MDKFSRPGVKWEVFMKLMTKLKKMFFLSFLFPVIPILAIPDDVGEEGNDDKGDEGNDDSNEDDESKDGKDPEKDTQVVFKSQKHLDAIINRRIKKAVSKAKEEAEKEKEKANMSEIEKIKAAKADSDKKAEEYLLRANKTLIRAEIVSRSHKFNIVDPAAAYKLIDTDDIEIDESGKISGVDEALEQLVKDKSYLVREDRKHTSGDDQNAGQNKKKLNYSMNAAIRRAAGKK
jgi:hypothetical protein